MFEWFRRWRRPGFDVNDLLPFVQVPAAEQPIVLERLDVGVRVSGMFAETTQTMVFRNPNRRVLEGELSFPLPADGVVCGYAIDLDGELVEGAIVARQEARRILETEIRKGVDPGLVEQVQGNVYRARIYPLPAGGTRTVRLTYVCELAVDGDSAGYHLPLAHAKAIERVTLRVEITRGEVTPVVAGGPGRLTLTDLREALVAEATLARGAACDDLVVTLPALPPHLRTVERAGDEVFFAISSAAPAAGERWQPRRVALVWDASGSRTDLETDLAMIAALAEAWPALVIDVLALRDVIDGDARSFTAGGERDALLAHLRGLARDGGTDLAALPLAAPPHPDDEAWLVFSDGLATVGRGVAAPGALPVFTLASSARADAAYLRHLADRSGGLHLDLLRTSPAAAIDLLAGARAPLRVAATAGTADVHARRTAGRLTIVGRLTAELGQVRLAGDGAPADHLTIARAQAVDGHLVARAWAGQEAGARAVVDADDPEILALARRHGVVTAGASLLVLDTLEQHLEHGVEPAASRTAMRRAYLEARERAERDERDGKASHLEEVVALWEARVRWWQTDFAAQRRRSAPKKSAARPSQLRTRAGLADESVTFDARMLEREAPAPAMAPPPAPPPAGAFTIGAAAPVAVPADALMEEAGAVGGATPLAEDVPAAAEAAPRASIAIRPWTADAPYLTRLRDAADPYVAYLRERDEYAASPAFFLDVGDLLLARGERARGLRVLSNLLELALDDPPLLRMYGWRLQAAGELDGAIAIFERVRRMRGDEPQSHRDLALALGERWERAGDAADATDATRAMELLYDVVERGWERFPEIELIALMELNRLIARAAARGVATPARIDRRLVKLLDVDLRISMSWDLDLTDVDLHVFEPDGEHAYYGQNQTSGGGLVSRDFRQGYGPEEYVRRRAQPGAYTVKAHYYGSHQQSIAGACTVIVHVFTGYGRADEARQVLTLRLDRPSDQVVVGEVTFAGAERAGGGADAGDPDWRPRFARLARGMTIDEIVAVVGQPARIEGQGELVLVYQPGTDVVHVVCAPRLTAVRQVMDGALLELI
jgi:hypothetical protein